MVEKIGLPAVTRRTITTFDALEREIQAVQQRGYGFEDQELREGVRRVAAPIFNFDGEHVGCIGLSATIFSFELGEVDKFGRLVPAAARKISTELEHGMKGY